MICTTPAIVIRTVDFSESSKIVTLLTKSNGKLAVIAKGAKKPGGKFTGLMDIGNILEVVFYLKNNRSVQTLTQASIYIKTHRIRYDFEKMVLATKTMELVNQLLHEYEENVPVYEFIENFLKWLGTTEKEVFTLFPYIQLRLAALMGIGLNFVARNAEGTDQRFYFNIETGTVSADRNKGLDFELTSAQSMYMMQALRSHSAELTRMDINRKEVNLLINHLDVYYKYHIEGFRDRRSDAVFNKMME